MTMPAKMNCEHDGDGWCLSCVGILNDEADKLRAERDLAEALLREAMPYVAHAAATARTNPTAGGRSESLAARIDAFLAGQPAPKSAESEARMLRKCLARVRATIDSDEELKARYVAAAAKMPLDQTAPDVPQE